MEIKKVILFDGVCSLCNRLVQFIITHDKNNQFLFASLQSNYSQEFLKRNNLNLKDFDSIILVDQDNFYTKSTAALNIAKLLDNKISWIWIFIFIPKSIRDSLYDIVAKNRYRWFGKNDVCWLPSKELMIRFLE